MGEYKEYITSHISEYRGQEEVNWNTPGYRTRITSICKSYNEKYKKNELEDCINRLSNINNCRLGRQDVSKLFNDAQTYYDGYVATLLWGKINLTQYNDITKTNGFMALMVNKSTIETIIKDIFDSLGKNDLHAAFESLSTGKNRIPGIGLSYFTKLLFFIPNNLSPKPLIYDKWGIRIHAGLLKDEENNYQERININDPQPKIIGNNIYESYIEYCAKIDGLYDSLRIDRDKDIEAFLFGQALRGRRGTDRELNPRKMLVDYLGLKIETNKSSNKEGGNKTRAGVKSKISKKNNSNSETPNQSQLSSLIKKKLPSLRETYGDLLNTNPRQIKGGPKPMLTAKISNGATLAIGIQGKTIFCGEYLIPEGVDVDANRFPKKVKAGYYKPFKLDQAEEALNFFKSILDQSKL